MTKSSLHVTQRQTITVIEALGFGVIEQLLIRGGVPCFEPAPIIIQTIKLNSQPDRRLDPNLADLKQAFESLFNQLRRLRDGVVNIEVRHGLPFTLEVARRYQELL